jgi:hypothetical protein
MEATTMLTRDLVELAALVAVHGSPIALGADPPPAAVQEYWAASRCRFDRWTRVLKRLSDATTEMPRPAALSWPRIEPVLEEILGSELLTRIWSAAAIAHDRTSDEAELEPIVRNVLAGHLDVRRRLLVLVADGLVLAPAEAVKIDQVRRRVERWTDMLLAHLAREIDIGQFAFDPQRANDFADDLDHDAAAAQRRFTTQLILSSLRGSFATLADHSPNVDLNRRIGVAIVHSCGDALAQAIGLSRPLWLQRIAATADSAQNLIDQLVRQ